MKCYRTKNIVLEDEIKADIIYLLFPLHLNKDVGESIFPEANL